MSTVYGAERSFLIETYTFRSRVAVSKFGYSILLDFYSVADFVKLSVNEQRAENRRIAALIAPRED